MLPYAVLIMSPIIVQHIMIGKAKSDLRWYTEKSKISLNLFWLLLFLMLSLRHEFVGVDTPVYEYIFRYVSDNNWIRSLQRSPEIAWSFINKLIASMGGNFRWVIAVISLISVFWIARAYVRYSDDATLTIALFVNLSVFVFLFSGLRQSVAVSLGFLAFEFVRKKKIIPFILIIILAMLFHTSAFMLFFMYPLYHLKITRKRLIFVVPILVVTFVFNQQIFTFLGTILNSFTDYDTDISLTGSITMLVLFCIFAVFAFVIPDESELDADTAGMRNFLVFSVALQMFASLHPLAMRMNYYYIAFIPMLIPRIIKCRSLRMSQVAIIARYVMIVFFVVYFFISAPNDDILEVFPYMFFWE